MSSRVVVIGDPASVFVQTPVRFWRDRGVDAIILTARWQGASTVDGDLPVVSAESLAPPWVVSAAQGVHSLLDAVNTSSLAQDPARVSAALRAWAHTAVPPSVAPPAHDALLIAAAADALDPVCVFGHEAFAHGLATSCCTAPRRALMAWGADVLQYALMTDVAHALVRQALHGVHYVLTNTATMEDVLHERFDVPRPRIARISYGVDRRLFHRAAGVRASEVRHKYGIAAGARVVMNIRRFLPHWGSGIAWPAMVAVAEQRPDVHLVVLGGSGSDEEIAAAAGEARARGLDQRITFVRDNAPLNTVAELMSVADVSLSLVGTLEPVSWSVQQAVACASAVVVADQASYALESDRGLAVYRLRPFGVADVCNAVTALLDDRRRTAAMALANERYVTTHHDRETELTRLLHVVAGSATAERLLTAGALAHHRGSRPSDSRCVTVRAVSAAPSGLAPGRAASEAESQHLAQRLALGPRDV